MWRGLSNEGMEGRRQHQTSHSHANVESSNCNHESGPNIAAATQNDTLTMPHSSHAICMLLPLDTALSMRFAQNTQHKTNVSCAAPAAQN